MGRKKSYDRNEIVSSIKRCFWRQGYVGTTLLDLEEATGLPKQTLYREFGDKRGMYLASLADYERREVDLTIQLLQQDGTSAERVRALFLHILDEADTPAGRMGCFLCNAIADRTGIEPEISGRVAEALHRLHAAFAETLASDGDEDHAADSMLAGYIGLRNLIRNNWPIVRLRKMADGLFRLLEN